MQVTFGVVNVIWKKISELSNKKTLMKQKKIENYDTVENNVGHESYTTISKFLVISSFPYEKRYRKFFQSHT